MRDILKGARALIDSYTDDGRIPCAIAAVVEPEHTYTCYGGYSSLTPEKQRLKEHDIFDLASLTKVVSTTTLALQCMEQGLFSLETPVRALVPGFPYDAVTIRQVMTHTSGICHDDKAYKQCKTKEELRDFFFQKPLEFTPGSQVVYSDFGYITLGYVVEAAIGPLDQAFQRQIAKPLDMNDTGYCPEERGVEARCVPTEITPERGKIQGEVHDGKAHILQGVSGNAGLFSTIEDLTHFARMLLGNGCYNGKQVLSPASVTLLKRCYTENLNARRTLGWWVDEPTMSFGDYYSDCCIYHTGFTGTSMYIDFKRRCSIIILTNRIHPTRENPYIKEFRDKIHNVILAEYDKEE